MACRSLTPIHHEINGAQDARDLLLVASQADNISVSLAFSLTKKQGGPWSPSASRGRVCCHGFQNVPTHVPVHGMPLCPLQPRACGCQGVFTQSHGIHPGLVLRLDILLVAVQHRFHMLLHCLDGSPLLGPRGAWWCRAGLARLWGIHLRRPYG